MPDKRLVVNCEDLPLVPSAVPSAVVVGLVGVGLDVHGHLVVVVHVVDVVRHVDYEMSAGKQRKL